VEEETIGRFLAALASGEPVPGGGAAAALQAALGAALVSMVCNLTIGREKYREHEATMVQTLREAEELRARALELAAADAESFKAVGAAYGLPRTSDEEKAARQAAVQSALKGASAAPLQTVALAAAIVELCAHIVDISNVNVISDVGVGVLSAQAALDSAALNVKINLAAIKDDAFKATTAAEMNRHLESARPLAGQVMERVEAIIAR
jgi:formiminotetrahydrofolate cyclodeaminase